MSASDRLGCWPSLAAGLTAELVARTVSDVMYCEIWGDPNAPVAAVSTFLGRFETALSYLNLAPPSGDHASGGVVLCSSHHANAFNADVKLVVDDPRAAFIEVLRHILRTERLDLAETVNRLAQDLRRGPARIHPTAIVGDNVVIGADAEIGAGAILLPCAVIGEGSMIRSGAIIGEDGLVVHRAATGALLSQPHIGTVVIGPECEIGAGSVVMRGMVGPTRIGARTRVGSLVHLGHGALVGPCAWIASGSKIGGHASIGSGASLGLGTIVRDNVSIGANASIAMGSVVTQDIADDESALGNPARISPLRFRAGPRR